MESLLIVIIFLLMLIVSNVINRIFPKFPLPMIQLFFGIGIGLLLKKHEFELDSELFLAFVIAPLNFREGQESDISSFIKYKKITSYLILPTVFITMLAIGYVTGKLLSIEVPLAASFALGAALAPTDAVAFLSISKRFNFPKRISTILTLEGLLNDASGLVAFQFAIATLITGSFSLLTASFQLFWAIIGGFLVGLVISLLNRAFLSLLEKIDAADVTGALLLELTLPILSYFVASLMGVSGIIACVISGLSQASRFKKIRLFDAEVDRVSMIVWNAINFILNGFVFILFGFVLTDILKPALENEEISNLHLFLVVIVVTLLLFVIRFLMISIYAIINTKNKNETFKFDDVLLLTFSGVKGTVSIATILLLPKLDTYDYSVLIFIVGSVTLLSFLTGMLVLPMLNKGNTKTEDTEDPMQIAILNDVIQVLEEDIALTDEKGPLYAAIDNYNSRIENLILDAESAQVKKDLAHLRLMIIGIESDSLEYYFSKGQIDIIEYRIYQRYLHHLEDKINRGFVSTFKYFFRISLRVGRKLFHELITLAPTMRDFLKDKPQNIKLTSTNREHLLELYLINTELVLESLADLDGVYDPELLAFLKHSRLREAEIMESGAFVERVLTRVKPDNIDEMLRGYYLERKLISEYEKNQLITEKTARHLRQNVNKLESYSLREASNTIPYQVISQARGNS